MNVRTASVTGEQVTPPFVAAGTSGSPFQAVLPPARAEIVTRLAAVFAMHGQELALVGGIVRDLLLGNALPTDLDFATDAVPAETTRLGELAGATAIFDVGARFGTIGMVFQPADGTGPVTVEITTYRSEYYPTDTRHPEVAFGHTLEEDLSRRDFTVNAIAASASRGELIDPFEGQADLARGLIRAVGNADDRFQEDPLRLLRAARFVSQLGFLIAPETAAAMRRQAHSLSRISEERILNELTRTLTGRYASHGLEALRETGLFSVALPELQLLQNEVILQGSGRREKDLWRHTLQVVDQAPDRSVVRWAALLHDAAKPQTRRIDADGAVHFLGHERQGAEIGRKLLARLKADKATQANVGRLIELHYRPETYDASWTDSAVRRLMLEAGPVLDDLLDLAAADVTSAREQRQREAADRIARLRVRIETLEADRALAEFRSPLDGDDLMALFSRPPGRWIAEIKDHLRELVLEGDMEPGDRVWAEVIARQLMAAIDA